MPSLKLRPLLFLLALAVVTVGCASGGGGDAPAAPAAPAAAPEPDVREEVGDNGLPTPRALVARHLDAIGGEAALKKHSSRTVKGSMSLEAMGMSGDVVIYAQAPNSFVMTVEMGGMGSMNNGYNGEIGWSDSAMGGSTILEGGQLRQAQQQADYYGPLNYDKTYPTQETVELTDFEGQSAYKVKLTDAEGTESTQFFAEDSGFLVGSISVQAGPMGDSEVTQIVGDYKDFDGLRVATSTVLKMMGMDIKQTVSEVTFDDVAPENLEPPDSIKSQLN